MPQPPRQPQPDQGPEAELLALVAAQAAIRARYTAQAIAMATAAVNGFTGWYDSGQITAWAAALADRIEALQRAIAQTTDAYLARALSQMTGRRVRPVGRVDVASLRTGVTHAGAYARAADVYRWQQSQFDTFARQLADSTGTPAPFDLVDPIEAAANRVKAVADMDAQLAFRAQSQQTMTDAADRYSITGYRRVIHPELSSGGSCGLCIAASDRLYGATEPLPIHAECHCTTLPVLDNADPGSTLNELDLKRLYRDAGGTGRQQLKARRYQVDEHGELGPVLNPRGAKVRTEREASRDTNRVRQPKSDAEKAAAVRRIRTSLVSALPKARDLAASDPKTWGSYLTKLEERLRDLDNQLAA
jgi:hypothetical protein